MSILFSDAFPLSAPCLWHSTSDTPQTLLPVTLSTQTPASALALSTTCPQGAWGCCTPKPRSLQLCSHSASLPPARRLQKCSQVPKDSQGAVDCCSDRFFVKTRSFLSETPCSLLAAVGQRCASLARGGQSTRLDCTPKAAPGKGKGTSCWEIRSSQDFSTCLSSDRQSPLHPMSQLSHLEAGSVSPTQCRSTNRKRNSLRVRQPQNNCREGATKELQRRGRGA